MPDQNEASSPAPPRPLLLKIPAACAVLSCSRSQMYLLLRSGEIKGTMIGPKQRRISYAELEAYVARKTGEPQSEAGAA